VAPVALNVVSRVPFGSNWRTTKSESVVLTLVVAPTTIRPLGWTAMSAAVLSRTPPGSAVNTPLVPNVASTAPPVVTLATASLIAGGAVRGLFSPAR
jgi:hypothetical protein